MSKTTLSTRLERAIALAAQSASALAQKVVNKSVGGVDGCGGEDGGGNGRKVCGYGELRMKWLRVEKWRVECVGMWNEEMEELIGVKVVSGGAEN
nr:hypothetical transcript [Hymenolepis microstoma]